MQINLIECTQGIASPIDFPIYEAACVKGTVYSADEIDAITHNTTMPLL